MLGEVTEERLGVLREADAIVQEEVRRAGLERELWQAFAVLLPVRTVGVMGDFRTYAEVMGLWERLHTPFLAAADMQADPVKRMEGYRTAIRVDYAANFKVHLTTFRSSRHIQQLGEVAPNDCHTTCIEHILSGIVGTIVRFATVREIGIPILDATSK